MPGTAPPEIHRKGRSGIQFYEHQNGPLTYGLNGTTYWSLTQGTPHIIYYDALLIVFFSALFFFAVAKVAWRCLLHKSLLRSEEAVDVSSGIRSPMNP